MPELPEVETIKRDLQAYLPGQRFDRVDIFDKRVIKSLSQTPFQQAVTGQTITAVERRGKGLIISLSSGYIVVQLKMTGQLIAGPHLRQTQQLKDTKVVFHLSNGAYLNYNDQRLFGWLIYADQLDQVPYLSDLGPEPFERGITPSWFLANASRRSIPIKTLLMDQQFIAGIGNIYASEICFAAKVNPQKPGHQIETEEACALIKHTRAILSKAIKCRGSSMRDYRDMNGEKGTFNKRVRVYGRTGEPCKRCHTPIERIVQAARSTFYCPACQEMT